MLTSYSDPKPQRDFPGDSEAKFYFVMNCTKDFWLIMSTPAGKTQINRSPNFKGKMYILSLVSAHKWEYESPYSMRT